MIQNLLDGILIFDKKLDDFNLKRPQMKYYMEILHANIVLIRDKGKFIVWKSRYTTPGGEEIQESDLGYWLQKNIIEPKLRVLEFEKFDINTITHLGVEHA